MATERNFEVTSGKESERAEPTQLKGRESGSTTAEVDDVKQTLASASDLGLLLVVQLGHSKKPAEGGDVLPKRLVIPELYGEIASVSYSIPGGNAFIKSVSSRFRRWTEQRYTTSRSNKIFFRNWALETYRRKCSQGADGVSNAVFLSSWAATP
jgi:hypothetical protein